MPNNDSNYIQTYNHPHGQVLINEQTLTDIADAIREQRLTDNTFKPAQFAGKIIGINEIEGGEYEGDIDLSVEEKDVNFYDYDGTRVYSYGKEEFLGLNSLPDNPSHDNLVAQGWNWSLSDAKEYVQNYGILDVGQIYNSKQEDSYYDYGYLQIDIELKEGYLSPVLYLATNATGEDLQDMYPEIFWGDGTQTGVNNIPINQSHTYSTPGKYTIVICEYNLSTQNCKFLISGTSSGSSLFTGGGTNDDIYRNCITAVRVGSCVKSLGNYAFKNCNSLRTITLHKTLALGQSVFDSCYSLKAVVLPSFDNEYRLDIYNSTFAGCSSLQRIILSYISRFYEYKVFKDCVSLKNIIIPENPQTGYLGESLFSNCYSLKEIIIPSSITSMSPSGINNQLFSNCYSLKRIMMYPINPPRLETELTNLPTYTKIYVPWSRGHSVLQAYKTATYWSDIADQIYQMPMSIENTQAYAEFNNSTGSLTFFRDLSNKYTNNQTESFSGELTINYLDEYEGQHTPNDDNSFIKITNTGQVVTPAFSIKIIEPHSYESTKEVTSLNPGEFWVSDDYYDVSSMYFKLSTDSTWTEITGNSITLGSGTKTYYTGIETNTNSSSWSRNSESIRSVIFEDKIQPKSTADWFAEMHNAYFTSITGLEKLDTSNVINMSSMFYQCQCASLDVSHFDTSNVTDMSYMFSGCSNLTSLDVSHFDTSKVTTMVAMFEYCQNLTTTLNIMNMPTNYGAMFYNAATTSGSQITLKYINPVTSANINTLVATKSSSSNVINGGQGIFVPPTPAGGAS